MPDSLQHGIFLKLTFSMQEYTLNVLTKLRISPSALILVCTLFATAVHNQLLFDKIASRLDVWSWSGFGYAVTLYVLMVSLLTLPLLVLSQRFLLKPLLITLLLLSAVLGYFTQHLGVVFDTDMIRNVAETWRDHNQKEATELLSWPLLKQLMIWGVLPGILVTIWPIKHARNSWQGILQRTGYVLSLLAATSLLFIVNNREITYFSRENGDLKVYITPLFAMHATYKYLDQQFANRKHPFTVLGTDAHQQKTSGKRTIGIMVVGETARADHFSLNGYTHETTPQLEHEKPVSFTNVHSCGTSTAYSVPCMFSFLTQDNYAPELAERQSNVLDVLQRAGVKVVWIDNNSSCKGVCQRIENINLTNNPDQHNKLYSDGAYYDEVMLDYLQQYTQGSQDVLIVLHTMGSHGPTYHKRFPADFARFTPYCTQDSPDTCTQQEVVNAYDNTILYSDYVMDKAIQWLNTQSRQANTFLLYASDHGESLGENGIYLHGLPYFLAPPAQTHIPMLLWLSNNYLQQHQTAWQNLRSKTNIPLSHDYLSHSLLGLYSVQTSLYQPEYDILH